MTGERLQEVSDELRHDFELAEDHLRGDLDLSEPVSLERAAVSELVPELPGTLRDESPDVIASRLGQLSFGKMLFVSLVKEHRLPLWGERKQQLREAFGTAADIEHLGVALGTVSSWNQHLDSERRAA